MQSTAQIIQLTVESPIHLRSECELHEAWISSRSRWDDPRWAFDNETPGSNYGGSTIAWEIELPDGSHLTDPQHGEQLGWLKRLVWSLHVAPGNGEFLKAGSMGQLSAGLRRFVWWMAANRYRWPHQLDPTAIDAYKDDLPEQILDEPGNDAPLSFSPLWHALKIPMYLWRQRKTLAKAGIAPMPAEPWGGQSAQDIALSLVTRPTGWIKPLPDEVAIPVLNKAAWFLGMPADDILLVHTQCHEAYADNARRDNRQSTRALTKYPRQERQLAVATRFRFSVPAGDTEPWHVPLAANNEETGHLTAAQQVRQLVLALRAACAIVVQATGGMRISEICGLPAGLDPHSDLPSCVRIETSASGLHDLFLVRTPLAKTEDTPRDVDWVIGMRPRGTSDIPLAVRALVVLHHLMEPYRQLAGSDRLLISLTSTQGLPKSAGGVGPITTAQLHRSIKDFVADWVDLTGLPDESAHKVDDGDLVPWRESKGRIIKTHQFRKTWATFALAVDSRLLPVIQLQFHHLSLAMTEGGYIGKNRLQIEPLESVKNYQKYLWAFEQATGRNPLAGKMGEQIEKAAQMDALRRRIADLPTTTAWREVVRFVDEQDLHLWFAPHGKCLPLVPTSMRCHEVGGTVSWLNREPNYSTREPSLCAGCDCFMLDARHRDYWSDRYVQNWLSYRQAERYGLHGQFRVVRERADQARKLLRKIGVDITPLDLRVENALGETADGP